MNLVCLQSLFGKPLLLLLRSSLLGRGFLCSFLGRVLHRLILPNIKICDLERSLRDSYIRCSVANVKKKMHLGPSAEPAECSPEEKNVFCKFCFSNSEGRLAGITACQERASRVSIGRDADSGGSFTAVALRIVHGLRQTQEDLAHASSSRCVR